MEKPYDPLAEPEIAVRIYQLQRRKAAVVQLIVGAIYLSFSIWFVNLRENVVQQLADTRGMVAGVLLGGSGSLVIVGLRGLLQPNPIIRVLVELSDRVRKLEGESPRQG